jgi:predicted methyltransferase
MLRCPGSNNTINQPGDTMTTPSRRIKLAFLSAALAGAAFAVPTVHADTTAALQKPLDAILAGSWRADANRARDQYRHPAQTLGFFDVRPNATVVEITPGAGAWYGELLAPLLKDQGQYIAANVDPASVPAQAQGYYSREATKQKEKFAADAARYGSAKVVAFNLATPQFGPANSADIVLTFRNVHNWVEEKNAAAMFKAAFDVLKPGGVFGVIDHRAADGRKLEDVFQSGYLPTAYVIGEATKAGFVLAGQSEVNANPKDTKDHPKGVWTLPPSYALGQQDRAKYQAIGESDRFTLKFVKPAK